MLLFVYDKNNGVLEYLLSLGMDQSDVFRAYLKAALFLGSVMFAGEVLAYAAISALTGVSPATVALVATLSFAMSLSAVSFVTVAMMAFSILQKQRLGANQPLGTGLGILLVTPSIFIPTIFPSDAPLTEIIYSTAVIIIGLTTLVLAARLISREKLLP